MKGWGLVIRVQEGGPRRNAFSAEQSRVLKVWSAIQDNVSGDYIDKDTHHEDTGQNGNYEIFKRKPLPPHAL